MVYFPANVKWLLKKCLRLVALKVALNIELQMFDQWYPDLFFLLFLAHAAWGDVAVIYSMFFLAEPFWLPGSKQGGGRL